jgi:hypothetical protein
MAEASSATIRRMSRKAAAAVFMSAMRSANDTFLFTNVSFELAGNSTCLAQARACLPARQPARRAVKGLPLDGEPRLLSRKERGEERLVRVDQLRLRFVQVAFAHGKGITKALRWSLHAFSMPTTGELLLLRRSADRNRCRFACLESLQSQTIRVVNAQG